MKLFEDIKDKEKGLSVRAKLNLLFRNLFNSGASINSTWRSEYESMNAEYAVTHSLIDTHFPYLRATTQITDYENAFNAYRSAVVSCMTDSSTMPDTDTINRVRKDYYDIVYKIRALMASYVINGVGGNSIPLAGSPAVPGLALSSEDYFSFTYPVTPNKMKAIAENLSGNIFESGVSKSRCITVNGASSDEDSVSIIDLCSYIRLNYPTAKGTIRLDFLFKDTWDDYVSGKSYLYFNGAIIGLTVDQNNRYNFYKPTFDSYGRISGWEVLTGSGLNSPATNEYTGVIKGVYDEGFEINASFPERSVYDFIATYGNISCHEGVAHTRPVSVFYNKENIGSDSIVSFENFCYHLGIYNFGPKGSGFSGILSIQNTPLRGGWRSTGGSGNAAWAEGHLYHGFVLIGGTAAGKLGDSKGDTVGDGVIAYDTDNCKFYTLIEERGSASSRIRKWEELGRLDFADYGENKSGIIRTPETYIKVTQEHKDDVSQYISDELKKCGQLIATDGVCRISNLRIEICDIEISFRDILYGLSDYVGWFSLSYSQDSSITGLPVKYAGPFLINAYGDVMFLHNGSKLYIANRSHVNDDKNVSWSELKPLQVAGKKTLGGICITDYFSIDEDGKLSPKVATETRAGIIKPGTGLSVDEDGTLSADEATTNDAGVIKIGSGLNKDKNGKLNVDVASSEKAGIIQLGKSLVSKDGVVDVKPTETVYADLATNKNGSVKVTGSYVNLTDADPTNILSILESSGFSNLSYKDGVASLRSVTIYNMTGETIDAMPFIAYLHDSSFVGLVYFDWSRAKRFTNGGVYLFTGMGGNTLRISGGVAIFSYDAENGHKFDALVDTTQKASKYSMGIMKVGEGLEAEDGVVKAKPKLADFETEGVVKGLNIPDEEIGFGCLLYYPYLNEDSFDDFLFRGNMRFKNGHALEAVYTVKPRSISGISVASIQIILNRISEVTHNCSVCINDGGEFYGFPDDSLRSDTGGRPYYFHVIAMYKILAIDVVNHKMYLSDNTYGNPFWQELCVPPTASATQAGVVKVGSGLKVENGVLSSTVEKGDKGDKGDPFMIQKTYPSIEAMNAGYATDSVPLGGMVMVNTGNVEDEDDAKVYSKTVDGYEFIVDLSGAQGIKGEKGDDGEDGDDGLQGLGIYRVAQTLSSSTLTNYGRAAYFTDTVLNGRILQVGDLFIEGSVNSYLYRLTDVTSSSFSAQRLISLRGQAGNAAGFGEPTATVDANTGTPSVEVSATGSNTSKVFNFAFSNLKGDTGKQGAEGLGFFRSSYAASTATTSIALSTVTIPTGRSVKEGDLIIANNTYSYVFRVTAVSSTAATVTYITSMRGATGATGAAGADATIGSSINLPGSPTTTTQSVSDNSTKIATTAYVNNLLKDKGEGNRRFFILNSTADYFRTNGSNRGGTKNNTEPAALYYAILKSLDWGFCCLVGNTPQSVQINNPTSYANNNNIYKTADDMWVNLVTIDGSESARWHGIKVYPGGDDWYIYLFPSIIFPYTSADALKANIQSMYILPFL